MLKEEKIMRAKVAAQLNSLNTAVLVLTAFLTPLLVLDKFTEYFETPKLIFLGIVVLVLLLIKGLTWVIEGKVTVARTPLDLPLLLILVVAIISSVFGPLHYVSIVGNIPRVHGS